MKPVLFTTGCPQCKILKAKLDKKEIDYIVQEDLSEIISLGFQSVPVLKLSKGNYLTFSAAIQWINTQE